MPRHAVLLSATQMKSLDYYKAKQNTRTYWFSNNSNTSYFSVACWLTKFYGKGPHYHQQNNQSPLFVIYFESNHRSPRHSEGNKYLYLFLEM